MKITFCFLLLFFLSTSLYSDVCEQFPKVEGNTLIACEKKLNQYFKAPYEGCSTTLWYTYLEGQALNCYKKVMNHELDKRLLTLKEKNPAQFSQEMEIQKKFNEGMNLFCAELNRCEGTMFNIERAACSTSLVRYRTIQASQINKNKLTIGSGKKVNAQGLKFKAFAEALCKIDSKVWKGSAVPVDCENQVLKEIQLHLRLNSEDVCVLD